MLPSPATERTKSKNIPLDLQLTSCEAQRDLVFARAPEPLNQRNWQRTASAAPPNRHFETPHPQAGAVRMTLSAQGVLASRLRPLAVAGSACQP